MRRLLRGIGENQRERWKSGEQRHVEIINVACDCEYAHDSEYNGVTSRFDVRRWVNVAFRNGDPAAEFCDPCVSAGL